MARLYCRAEPCSAYRKKEAEPADKPGSVVDSHSSRRYVTATLKQPTRIQRGPRQRIPIWSCSRWGLPCRSVARLAVRSYRTISPLPAFRRRRRRYLSVALSVGLRRPGVTWHLALWSPDFPPLRPSPPEGGRRRSGDCLVSFGAQYRGFTARCHPSVVIPTCRVAAILRDAR